VHYAPFVTDLRSLPRYPLVLFLLLCGVTSFEGFDTKLASLLLPLLGQEFQVGPEELGRVLSRLGAGTVAAFFIVRLADRFGRRPILLFALGGYSSLTLATYFSASLMQFTVLQFSARMLMVTQLALAYIILSEELPARVRGRANGLLGAFASVGAALPAAFLAPLEDTAVGWRGLFLLGALPLLLLPLLVAIVREPPVFVARRRAAPPPSVIAQIRILFGSELRRRTAGVTLLWFTINFWSAAAVFFFTYYVFQERGWTARDLQLVVPAAVPFAFAGYSLGGWLMDAAGRRIAAAIFLALGTAIAIACYQVSGWWTIAASWVGLQMLQGIWPIASTMTAELFPTQVRAAAVGFTGNLVGRLGLVVGPQAVGALSVRLDSTGDAVSLLALLNLVAIPLLFYALPETRGVALDR
jgi:putative MFS transporter